MEKITLEQLLNWLAIVANIIVLLGGSFIIFRKAKPEIDKIRSESTSENAQAVESYANATRMYSEELSKVRAELKDLRRELDSKDRAIEDRDKIILNQKTVIEDVTDWAERLVHQVKSLGGTPVPLRSERTKKKE